MAAFKCKMCGAQLDVKLGETVVTCDYCGSRQTVSNGDDERKANLFNRANELRQKCEFDKALLSYQSIISLFPHEPEAHWGLALCRYGIEYVEDPVSHKRKPTMHRASFESILKDSDYLEAISYADIVAKEEYQEEAEEISNIQKNILSISQKEEPFDIFICYKESDEYGKRTPDSVLAQDIYSQLTDKGYKVFFSRITLESKIGVMYEPYIFAALNSAKVMLVIGTKKEYFDAVWVKNEWSRFLSLMQTKTDKYIIPCYRGMDAYQMPEELLSFQAQDMGKLGFLQDLMRGIDKLMGKNAAPQPSVVQQIVQSDVNVKALVTRAEILIGDGDYPKADSLLEKVLNNDPKNSRAYLLKCLEDLHLHAVNELKNQPSPLTGNRNFMRAYDFGSAEEKKELDSINEFITNRNENDRLQGIYNQAVMLKMGKNYKQAEDAFRSISGFQDADKQAEECVNAAKQDIYDGAMSMKEAKNYAMAESEFEKIKGFKDADDQAAECIRLGKKDIYDKAMSQKEAKDYLSAIETFRKVSDFMDAEFQIQDCQHLQNQTEYDTAMSMKNAGSFDDAKKAFLALGDFQDSVAQAHDCDARKENARKEEIYLQGKVEDINRAPKAELQSKAEKLKTIPGYKDADALVYQYEQQIAALEAKEKEAAKKRRKRIRIVSIILLSTAAVATGAALLTTMFIIPSNRQSEIIHALNDGDYDAVDSLLDENGSFGDSAKLASVSKAGKSFESGDYESGIQSIYDAGGSVNVAYDGDGGSTPSNGTLARQRNIKYAYVNGKGEKAGYDFHGWILTEYTLDAQNFSASIGLKASYDIIRYDISYDLDGGSVRGNPLTYDTEHEETLPKPTRTGYTFLGWTGSNGDTPQTDVTIEKGTIGNQSYKANWQANTYAIHLSTTKGKLDKDTLSVVYGTQYTLPTPTYSGYDFHGWYDANGNVYSTGKYEYPGDLYLTDSVTLIHYGIYYVLGSDDATNNNPTSYTVEDSITIAQPTRTGYTFLGWTGSNGDTPSKSVTIAKGTTGNLNYTANWERKTYTVTLDSTIDEVSDSTIQAKNGTEYSLPTYDVGEAGYEFAWFDGDVRMPSTGTWDIASDFTLTGKKVPIVYTITYDLDGGTNDASNPATYTIEDNITLKAPTKNNKGFAGWTGSNGDTPQTEVTIAKGTTGNLSYKANWTLPTYSVGSTLTFGSYPQTKVTDSTLVAALASATDTDNDGWLNYDNEEYAKQGSDYYRVEPITWKVLSADNTDHQYMVVSEKVLDQVQYYTSTSDRTISGAAVYANNYRYSTLRAWMNGYDGSSYSVANYSGKGFLNTAFTSSEQSMIVTTDVDNSVSSTGYSPNSYACENTSDKVFSLSYSEATNSSYGFSSDSTRIAYATGYASAKGVYVSGGAYYWLRSPDVDYSISAEYVYYDGYISNFHYVNYTDVGVRPALSLRIS